MVKPLSDTPGFVPVSPSIIQQIPEAETKETPEVLGVPETPLGVTASPAQTSQEPVVVEETPSTPLPTSRTEVPTPSTPSIEAPSLTFLESLLDDSEEDELPTYMSPPPSRPTQSGRQGGQGGGSGDRRGRTYLSSLLDDPEETGPLSSTFVDPNTNDSVLPEVRQRYQNKRMPAAIRLNNMGAVSIVGNVSKSYGARQAGFVGTVKRPAAEGGYYAQYATPEHGVAAASNLLVKYGRSGTNTPVQITRKWAAEPGNYPNVLVKYLNQAGISADRNTRLDLNDVNTRIAILKAKSAHESGFGKPVYSDSVFQKGVNMPFIP